MQRKRLKIYGALACLMLAAGAIAGVASVEPMLCHAGPATDDGYGNPTLVDCPAAMAPLLERYYGCQHWGGEEPYDADRAAQIEAAVTKLECHALDADIAAFRSAHAEQADVLSTWDRAVGQSSEE
jgi:hypothetical protein